MPEKFLTRRLKSQLFLFTCGLAAACFAHANPAQDILKKARQSLESKSDKAHLVLKIIEPEGEVKAREMVLQILRTGSGFKSVIRMTAPADVKDTAVLAEVEDGQDREWLYLPSSKQVRRIASTKKSAGIFGSELSPEDLDPMALKSSSVNLIKSDDKMAQVALVPKRGSSEYSKVVTTFTMPGALPAKTEYYKGANVEKVVEYQNYKPFPGGLYRAQNIHIQNVRKRRGTDIQFSDMTVDPPLLAKDFTPDALKENW
jgi:hypothetical protein